MSSYEGFWTKTLDTKGWLFIGMSSISGPEEIILDPTVFAAMGN